MTETVTQREVHHVRHNNVRMIMRSPQAAAKANKLLLRACSSLLTKPARMAPAPCRGGFVVWLCTILLKRQVLPLRGAFATALPFDRVAAAAAAAASTRLIKNMIAKRSTSMLMLLHAPAALGTRGLLLLSARWAGHASSHFRLEKTGVQSSPSSFRGCSSLSRPGASADDDAPTTTAAGEPPATAKQWKLYDHTKRPPVPVSLGEYVALGPGYRAKRSQRQEQQQQPVPQAPTAETMNSSPSVDDSDSDGTNARECREGEKREEAREWLPASLDLAASLDIKPSTSTEAHHRRIFHLYLPVYFWLKHLLSPWHRRAGWTPSDEALDPVDLDLPLVVGISAPQGCGKTTLVSEMQRMLDKAGYRSVVVSIDDFYLTGEEQDALAARYPTNPLLQVRGNAGTHDLALALRTIRAVAGRGKGGGGSGRSGDAESAGIRVPRYDKSARGGKGDRAPDDDWGVVAERPDIVLLEGWMLGFEALPDESSLLVSAGKENDGTDNGLGVVNTFLKDYRELHDEVDAWLVLKTAEPEVVFEWRAEAERRMRDAGRPGMSEEQVRDFCSRYMPAYRAYLPGLYKRCGGETAVGDDDCGRHSGEGLDGHAAKNTKRRSLAGGFEEERTLVIEVGRDRNPVL